MGNNQMIGPLSSYSAYLAPKPYRVGMFGSIWQCSASGQWRWHWILGEVLWLLLLGEPLPSPTGLPKAAARSRKASASIAHY
jgi:hypothetical protein